MSSGISKDKRPLDLEECLDTIVEPLDLSKVCVPFSIVFEDIDSEKESVAIKNIPFAKLDPEFRTILIKEFLE